MAETGRWTIHIHFTDGTEEQANGDPSVVDDVLRVQDVNPEFPHNVWFEAGYPLRHVKFWWVDYEHDAAPRAEQ